MDGRPPPCFGPVPSRRLGQSLGVNNIPPKICTYACVYCQLGRTPRMQLTRQAFFRPEATAKVVLRRLEECDRAGVRVDYLSVVPDGEPTLDANLGELLMKLHELGPPVAVITNGSLLDRSDVRSELALADWVSVKVDAVRETTWRSVDRPHGKLRLEPILEGLRTFADSFSNVLVTESMLVAGVNDGEDDLEALTEFLAEVRPTVAYLGVPTRPPAEWWVRSAASADVVRAHAGLASRLPQVELLMRPESSSWAAVEPRRSR